MVASTRQLSLLDVPSDSVQPREVNPRQQHSGLDLGQQRIQKMNAMLSRNSVEFLERVQPQSGE